MRYTLSLGTLPSARIRRFLLKDSYCDRWTVSSSRGSKYKCTHVCLFDHDTSALVKAQHGDSKGRIAATSQYQSIYKKVSSMQTESWAEFPPPQTRFLQTTNIGTWQRITGNQLFPCVCVCVTVYVGVWHLSRSIRRLTRSIPPAPDQNRDACNDSESQPAERHAMQSAGSSVTSWSCVLCSYL